MLSLAEFSKRFDGIWAPGDPFPSQEPMDRILRHYHNKYRVAKAVDPKRIVEIGVRAGYSGYAFGLACPNAQYLGYDAYDLLPVEETGTTLEYQKHAQALLDRAYTLMSITRCNTHSLGRLPEADLYHVDGDHSPDGVCSDLKLVADSSDTAVVLIDDVQYERIYKGILHWCTDKQIFGIFVHDLRGELMLFKTKAQMADVAKQFPDSICVHYTSQIPYPTDP